ncbi:MAG: HD domain-containing protein [Bacilli bacterium]|nr:HD domain-containing protein [Bacilli bacterium]
MVIKGNKSFISIPKLWRLFERFLAVMGPSYVDHCVRTAYLMLRLCEQQKIDDKTKKMLVFASYFHDLGSIGKDKDYLLSCDYDTLHSVDGYLLLRYKSPLKEAAKVILYHHTAYDQHIDDPYFLYGVKIALCDRLDDWERNEVPYNVLIDSIREQGGEAFNPDDVDAMLKIVDAVDLRYDIKSGKYKKVLYDYIATIPFSSEEINGFLLMLSSLFELYDSITYNHSKTVAVVGYQLAKLMGRHDDDCFKCFFAGLIHDLGKIFIPLSILDKPARLTPEEFEVMKDHVVYSRELTKDLFPREIVDIATYHHERLDGTGYPNGLKDRQMTELEEIMQVSDVVSALLAKRSYKEEYPYEKVREILLRSTPDKFNKKVVDAFIDNHEEVVALANSIIKEGYEEAEAMAKHREELISYVKTKKAILPGMPLSNFYRG